MTLRRGDFDRWALWAAALVYAVWGIFVFGALLCIAWLAYVTGYGR